MSKKNQFKSFELNNMEHKLVKKDDGDYVLFSGYLSTFGNIDHVGDVVVKGAFEESLEKRKPKLLWHHDFMNPIGVFEKIEEDEKGLYVEGKMPLSDSIVRDKIYPQMKIGSINTLSIGYGIDEARYDFDADIRYLTKIDLWEGSLVTFPANEEAIVSLKSFMKSRKENEYTAFRKAEKFADIEYKWNEEEAKKRVSEKLEKDISETICDVVDDELVIVPRALFCMKAKICGAKGGINTDEERAKEILNRLYEKMDMEAPFEKEKSVISFGEKEVKNMPVSETSFVMRSEKCRLTKNASDDIAKKLLCSEANSEHNADESAKEETKKILKGIKEFETIFETKKGDNNE